MMTFFRMLISESYKIVSNRAWKLVLPLVLVLQPVFGLLEAKQLVAIGLDATPETHPELLEAIPPLDYFGFDATQFGLLPIVILGGIIGASEYRHHNLRLTLLYSSRRLALFSAKILSLFLSIAVLSGLSIFVTIAITHIGMGKLGLDWLVLSPLAWRFIGYTALQWVLLTALAFAIGLFCRNMIVPLVFLVPQIYNLGQYLAERWSWGKYLPIAASNLITATPVKNMAHEPLKGTLILLLWLGLALLLAVFSFVRRDVGGKY